MTYTVSLKKVEQLTPSVSAFFFEKPDGFIFLPGQYITVQVLDAHYPYDFTISSSPLDNEYLMVITNNSTTEYKQKLFSLKTGNTVSISGPFGGFYLRETDASQKVLLSGGLGITPYLSMTRFYAQKKLTFPLMVIATFPTKNDIVLHDELISLEKENQHIKITVSVTREEGSWDGHTGRITESLLTELLPNLHAPIFYICGSPRMVEATEDLLLSLGVSEEKIKVEQY